MLAAIGATMLAAIWLQCDFNGAHDDASVMVCGDVLLCVM
jgi:hypothetical protein